MTDAPPPRKRRSYQQPSTKKRSTGLRLSEEARETLARLAEELHISQTAVLELAIRRLAKEEGTTMNHRFATYQEAIEAGYIRAVKGVHKDVSGPGSFGYTFENSAGQRTVPVSFTEETNSIGRKGAIQPMFPPTKKE